MKASLILFASLGFSANLATAQCPLCGPGFEPTLPDEIVAAGGAEFPCSQWEALALGGSFTDVQCNQIANIVFEPCGCNATGVAPTEAPTFGPAPDCFDNLDNIRLRERTNRDVSMVRTYVVCPSTEPYVLGRADQTGQIIGGFQPFIPRPNVHYKCGDDGSSSNGCVILDGDTPVLSIAGDNVHSNVILEGFIFEESFLATGFFNRPGDITFIDCIFRKNRNLGVIISVFPAPTRRELAGDDEEYAAALDRVMAYSDKESELMDSASEESGRDLQTTTLTLTFRKVIFEDNAYGIEALGGGRRPGVVNVQFPETGLVFEEVVFRNNDFGDETATPRSWAINSPGPLTITDSCFIDNNFVGQGPVWTTGFPETTVSNNYGTETEGLACEFLAEFPDLQSFQLLANVTCTDFDADVCGPLSQPTPSPVEEAQPTPAPVRGARTQAPSMEPPSATPAPQETAAPAGGSAGSNVGYSALTLLVSAILAARIV